VEYLKPREFGDQSTTLVLKGLELCCPFRFMFLERNSDFAHMNIRMALPTTLHELVRNMERELNLLRRDAAQAGLDKANVWADFLDWEHLQKLSEFWRPLEARVRDCCTQIRAAKDPELIRQLRDSLVGTIEEIENVIRPLNTQMICELTDTLKRFCSNP